MDIDKILAELHKELVRIEEAIATLERLKEGAPRRGRPPRWLAVVAKRGSLAARRSGPDGGSE